MHQVEFQFAEGRDGLPSDDDMHAWITLALESDRVVELTVRFASEQEMTTLNERYRQKSGPTNVLSFPAQETLPDGRTLLGDVVVCAAVLRAEAEAQRKPLQAHTAHLLIHGVLHLEGYDHESEDEALAMEAMETSLLRKAGFDDPYQVAIQTALQGDDTRPEKGSNDD
mgnify:FL=1